MHNYNDLEADYPDRFSGKRQQVLHETLRGHKMWRGESIEQ